MKRVKVVGMGTAMKDLGQRHIDAIDGAEVLVGGSRHLAFYTEHPARKLQIKTPLSDVVADIRQAMAEQQVVVLASGDPLFYGIGKVLIDHLGEENVDILPNVSVMAEAFARIKKPWANAAAISLHGRDAEAALPAMLAAAKPLFVFTDPRRTPATVARITEERAPGRWHMCVFEQLGQADERISWHAPADAVDQKYREPNAVVLWPAESGQTVQRALPGGADDDFSHERSLITKPEIRAVVFSKLRPLPDHVMWDLGAGSGAVAVEAAAWITRGRIVAVEKNPLRVEQIRKNVRKFGVAHVEVRQLQMPEGLEALPEPDRVFVGGGGSDIADILRISARRLRPGGRMVVNLVVVETLAECLGVLESLGLQPQVVQVQVAKGVRMPTGTRFAANNPVFVVSAEKGDST